MKILALDTAFNACSVALLDGETLLASRHEARSRGHAERLLPMIQEQMSEAELAFGALDLIAVSVGPGTFTGLRIGLAAARGISLAADIPAIGITTLEALAASVPEEMAAGRPVVVASDARRKEVYLQTFSPDNLATVPEPLNEAKACPISQTTEALPDTAFNILGSGASLLKDAGILTGQEVHILDLDTDPDARVIGRLALHKGLPDKDILPPSPVYLRAPDAKLPGGISPEQAK